MICYVTFLIGSVTVRLKELRVIKGVTQKDVAKYIGCSPTVYSRYENEKREPDIQTICSLARFYGTSTDEVIGYNLNTNDIERRIL